MSTESTKVYLSFVTQARLHEELLTGLVSWHLNMYQLQNVSQHMHHHKRSKCEFINFPHECNIGCNSPECNVHH